MSYSPSRTFMPSIFILLLICFYVPLSAYIVRSTTLTKSHVQPSNTTNLATALTFYYDIHCAQEKISYAQAQVLSSAKPDSFKIIEAPTGASLSLFMVVDQLIEKIITSSTSFLNATELSMLNLREDQLLKTRPQLNTLLLPVLAHTWCANHTASYSHCIDDRLSLLSIYELIDRIISLKSYCILYKPEVADLLSHEIFKHIAHLNLSIEELFNRADTLLTQGLRACATLLEKLNNLQSKQSITTFAQELKLYQEVNKKAYQFLSKVNSSHKPFFMLLIERIDKFSSFTGMSLLPILGDSYTKFIDWFSSSSTRLMLLDIVALDLIMQNTPESIVWQIVMGASHAENIINFLVKEGYHINYDTAYTLRDSKNKAFSLSALLLNSTSILINKSLESMLEPLQLDFVTTNLEAGSLTSVKSSQLTP